MPLFFQLSAAKSCVDCSLLPNISFTVREQKNFIFCHCIYSNSIPFNLNLVKSNNDPVLKKRGITETVYFEGDFDYPFLDSLKSQKEGKWKSELKALYSKVKNNQDSRQRFFITNNIKKIPWVPSEIDIYLPYEMPLKLLKGYQEIKAGIGYGSF